MSPIAVRGRRPAFTIPRALRPPVRRCNFGCCPVAPRASGALPNTPNKKAAQPARPFLVWSHQDRISVKARALAEQGLFGNRLAGGAQVVGRRLARAAIRHDLVGDFLAFTQRSKSGTLDRADMYEHIVAA